MNVVIKELQLLWHGDDAFPARPVILTLGDEVDLQSSVLIANLYTWQRSFVNGERRIEW